MLMASYGLLSFLIVATYAVGASSPTAPLSPGSGADMLRSASTSSLSSFGSMSCESLGSLGSPSSIPTSPVPLKSPLRGGKKVECCIGITVPESSRAVQPLIAGLSTNWFSGQFIFTQEPLDTVRLVWLGSIPSSQEAEVKSILHEAKESWHAEQKLGTLGALSLDVDRCMQEISLNASFTNFALMVIALAQVRGVKLTLHAESIPSTLYVGAIRRDRNAEYSASEHESLQRAIGALGISEYPVTLADMDIIIAENFDASGK